jgi:hypothetical protein
VGKHALTAVIVPRLRVEALQAHAAALLVADDAAVDGSEADRGVGMIRERAVHAGRRLGCQGAQAVLAAAVDGQPALVMAGHVVAHRHVLLGKCPRAHGEVEVASIEEGQRGLRQRDGWLCASYRRAVLPHRLARGQRSRQPQRRRQQHRPKPVTAARRSHPLRYRDTQCADEARKHLAKRRDDTDESSWSGL